MKKTFIFILTITYFTHYHVEGKPYDQIITDFHGL
jgi:hypothetical protein